ncbi:hypothetical protein F183_A14270 [Bryobacterales bacterium F-183]|nr:hypothetical protein F183_A14270 [Bryobacterales bacterium F-183]
MTSVAQDLDQAKAFYSSIYPYEIADCSFAGIPFFSILKDGNALVCVFQSGPDNPITGTVPVLRVDSVAGYLPTLHSIGATVLIDNSVCPATNTRFALCADKEGNQFIVKEAA